MLVLKNLAGRKNVGQAITEKVTITPTVGDFSITELAAKKIGIYDGAFVVITEGADAEGNPLVYIAKGKDGVPVMDENTGEQKVDGRGRRLFQEGTYYGSAVSGKGGNSTLIKATSAAAWHILGGKSEGSTDFDLGEPVEAKVMVDELGNPDDENNYFVGTFYPLVNGVFRPKSKTASKEEQEVDEPSAESIAEASASDFEFEDTENTRYTSEGFEAEPV